MRKLAPLALIGFVSCSGCSSSPPPPQDAGSDAAISDASSEAAPEAAPCVHPLRPSYVPTGWREYEEYAPCSGIFVPTKPEELPPAPVWESCDADVQPPIKGCERIALEAGNRFQGASTDAAVADDGTVLLFFGRNFANRQTITISDSNGKVYSAAMAADLTRFAIGDELQSINPSRWIAAVANIARGTIEGFLVGDLTSIGPKTSYRDTTASGVSAVIGPPGILLFRGNSYLELREFSDPNKKLLDVTTPAENNGLPNSFATFQSGSLYYFGNAQRRAVQRRWDDDTGPVDFIDYGTSDHGAGDLGTDGKDMVWVETNGPATQTASWSTGDYWASPYVKNKADLKPRRLRSEIPNVLAGDPIRVGCGRAALARSGGMRILNIADGTSWFLANSSNPAWGWVTALAVTCDYVYARVGYSGPYNTIARIPIANLGPSTPPD